MDHVPSGGLSTPHETGSQAGHAGLGGPAAAPAVWPDVAVLCQRHHADLLRLALLLVGDRGCAEDVVQDVFTRLCARLGDTSSVSGPMADPLALIADATGSNLILDGGICNRGCTNEFNGWLHGGRLVTLRPSGFAHREAAEAW